MSKNTNIKVSRTGAYVVRAAESPSSRVQTKKAAISQTPSGGDKVLARAALRHKTAGTAG